MRTKSSLLCLVVVIVLIMTSCGTVEEKAITVATEYMRNLYTVQDYALFPNYSPEKVNAIADTYKPFFTNKGFDRFIKNRIPLVPLTAASKGKFKLQLQDVNLKNTTSEKNKAVFNYELIIIANYPEDKSQKTIKQSGQITLLKENNNWKIDNDFINWNDLFLRPESK